MDFNKHIVILIFLAIPVVCLGAVLDCPQDRYSGEFREYMNEISKIYYPDRQLELELSACKSNPNINNQKILVLVYKNKDSSDWEFFYDVDILIHDSASKKPVANYYRQKIWRSDAYNIGRVEIDTAKYYINKETRAFGVKEYWATSSRETKYNVNSLSLFIVNGNTILSVLNNLPISIFEGDVIENVPNYKMTTRTITIDESSGNKYRDLKINEKSCSVMLDNVSECDPKTIKKKNYIFKSNDAGYIYPQYLEHSPFN